MVECACLHSGEYNGVGGAGSSEMQGEGHSQFHARGLLFFGRRVDWYYFCFLLIAGCIPITPLCAFSCIGFSFSHLLVVSVQTSVLWVEITFGA